MRWWRLNLARLSPVALAAFVSAVLIPRPGVFVHVHADGDHLHVHADDHTADRGHHPHGHHHRRHIAAAAVPAHAKVLEASDLSHWHTQDLFHRVRPAGCVTITRAWVVVARVREAVQQALDAPSLHAQARAPPPRLSV